MREIVLDTETTGLDPKQGHRVIEIGALELINHLPTDNHYQTYINPERNVEEGAFQVHGLSTEFLKQQPVFADVVDRFREFIGDDVLIIHNAAFDIGFINSELQRLGLALISMDRTIDTLAMARKTYPGAQASLDALCRRFGISNSHRNLHGALIDADLLASVYLELLGGRQPAFTLNQTRSQMPEIQAYGSKYPKRDFPVTQQEQQEHDALLDSIKDPIWRTKV